MFEDKTRQELVDGIREALYPSQAVEALPLPDGAPCGLPLEKQQVLHDNWVEHLLNARRPETWNPQERAAVAFASKRVLKGMGY